MIIQYLHLVREVRRLHEGENDCGRFVKNKRYQETGKECSTTEQMIVKDDRGKAIAWHSVSRQMTCYHEPDVITV